MAAGRVPKRADWRVADGVRVEELDGSWLALDPAGGVVYRLEARAAEVMRLVAHRLPLPGHLVPAARELAGHGVLEHPLVDRRTALVGAGVVTLTGLAATILPSAARATSPLYTTPESGSWPVSGGTIEVLDGSPDFYLHRILADTTLVVSDAAAITDVSIVVVGGGGGGGRGAEGAGGGGGAGGVLRVLEAGLPNGNYAVTVGDGGAGRSGSSGTGATGGSSRLVGDGVDLLALGGGGGGGPGAAATAGGSGGGAGADDGTGDFPTGAGVATAGQSDTIALGITLFIGNIGGDAANAGTGFADERRAGGGGGAGAQGYSGVRNSVEEAGDGGPASLEGVLPIALAGGGGGAGGAGSPVGAGGAGGGAGAGNGGYGTGATAAGGNADANTGSGGGGSTNNQNGGSGGSGIVLVRYRLAS